MARGDTEYCRVELDFILDNPDWLMLSPSHAKIYMWLWCRAVKDRTETLEKRWSTRVVAELSHSRHRDVTELIKVGTEKGWIKEGADKRIIVCGVMGKHAKLRGWRDENGDPYGDDTGNKGEGEEKGENPPNPPGGGVGAFEIWIQEHKKRDLPTGANEMDASKLQDILDSGMVTEAQLEGAVNAMLDDKDLRSKTLKTLTKHLDRFLKIKTGKKRKKQDKLVLGIGTCECGRECSGMVSQVVGSGFVKCDCKKDVEVREQK